MRCVSVFLLVSFIVVVNGSSACNEYELPCDNGECISSAFWCDSSEECADGSDEKYCKKSGVFTKDPNKCSSEYFRCRDGPCIPLVGRCNGFDNCDDSSDEKNCRQEASPKSDAAFSSFKPLKSRVETTSTATRTATHQTSVKLDTRASYFSDSADGMEHSVQIMYDSIGSSDYSSQREKALNWLLSQRRQDYGWGDETPRAIAALYLADVHRPMKNETDMLMIKQLEVQLSLAMARNGTKEMKLADLALYINSLLASCKDPKNFYGENLVRTLRNGVNVAHAAQREPRFVNPSVYLTLCSNNASIHEDARRLHDMLYSRNAGIGRIDIQALALLTISCIFRNTNLVTTSVYDGLRKEFLRRMNTNGKPGNVYEASLLAQALQELKVTQPDLLDFILSQQREDGSFGGILATYLVLPTLARRSFLQLNDHCSQQDTTDLAPLEVLKNPKRRKIFVQYSLNYGYPPEITETIQMQVAEGINFLDVMRLSQEVNPKFRFMLDDNSKVPVVYSIGGVPNDAEKGTFWTLYLTSKNKRDAGSLVPYSGNIKQLIPHPGDEFIFWMRSI